MQRWRRSLTLTSLSPTLTPVSSCFQPWAPGKVPYPEHMQSKLLYTSALDERNNLQGVPTAWDPRYRPSHTGADARVYKRWNSFVYDRGELREDDTGKWGVGVYIYTKGRHTVMLTAINTGISLHSTTSQA